MRVVIIIVLLASTLTLTDTLFAQEIQFQKVAEIHPDQLQGSFITDVTVNSSGFITVALNDLARVRLYDRSGKLINEYGRRGRGPGDFTNLMTVELTDSIVYAMDSGPLGRIHAFDRDNPESYQTFLIPRSPHGGAVRMWHIGSDNFLVEFRPSYSNLNIEDNLISRFGLISLNNGDEIRPVFESRSNEMFVDQSDGGFSVSSMPFGRKNYIIPSGSHLYHNWSDEFTFNKIELSTSKKSLVKPELTSDRVSIDDESYRNYFFNELGISIEDNIAEALEALSSDRSASLRLRTINAKIENRENLHDTYPAYKWVTGDSNRICFGMYTQNNSTNDVACMDEYGTILGRGTLTSNVEILSKQAVFIAGVKELEYGLKSVVLYKIVYN